MSSAEASGSDAPVPFDPAAVTAQAKVLLQGAGALFTIKTVLSTIGADAVAVRSILFSSSGDAHTFDFTLHPLSRQVTELLQDGLPLPYATSLDAFARWAKGETR